MRRPNRPRTLSTSMTDLSGVRAVGMLLNIHAERDPDRPALTFEGVTLTRRELAERVNRLSLIHI